MIPGIAFLIPIVVLVLIVISAALKILREYERGVVFTLGRFTSVKGPGLILLVPYVQQMVRVDLRTRAGGAESGVVRDQIFSAGTRMTNEVEVDR